MGILSGRKKKHTNHRIEEKMNNKDIEKITLDLSFPFNSLARPNLRSFYKTITNCTHCGKLHALNTKRISSTIRILSEKSRNKAHKFKNRLKNQFNSVFEKLGSSYSKSTKIQFSQSSLEFDS